MTGGHKDSQIGGQEGLTWVLYAIFRNNRRIVAILPDFSDLLAIFVSP